ncbi:hypothetical protein Tco_0615489 [Tanacetum coccineum]
MYDSWKIRIMLYIEGNKNATEGTPEHKLKQRLEDLTPEEKLRKSCDIKDTNIILLGLPVDIYTLVNHHKTAKEIWDRVKKLMEGTELTLQERESKLYDDFDRFMSEKGEPIHSYYLRYSHGYGINTGKGKATGTGVINTARDVKANPPRDSEWILLAHAQESGVILHEVQQDFLADRLEEMDSDSSAIFMASLSLAGSINGDTVGPTYDSDIVSKTEYTEHLVSNNDSYDELTNDNNVISYADYTVTTENDDTQYVPPEQYNVMILSVIEKMQSQVERCNTVITQRQQFEVLSNMHSSLKNNFETLKKESSTKEDKFLDEILVLEKEKKKLQNIVYKTGQIVQTMHMLTKPQVFYDGAHKTALGYQNPLYLRKAQRIQPVLYSANALVGKHDPIFMCDSEETLILAEKSRLKMKEKQKEHDDKLIDYAKLNKLYEYFIPQKQLSAEQVYWSPVMVKDSLQKIKDHLTKFDVCIENRTVILGIYKGSWGVSDIKDAYIEEVVPFVTNLKESFKLFEMGLVDPRLNRSFQPIKGDSQSG